MLCKQAKSSQCKENLSASSRVMRGTCLALPSVLPLRRPFTTLSIPLLENRQIHKEQTQLVRIALTSELQSFPLISFPLSERLIRQKDDHAYSSSTGISSSMYRIRDILISVVSFPRRTSLMKCASTCICTISRAPLSIPQKIFENHNSSCARPSSGNSTKSARGFSSKTKENCLASLVQFVTVGVILRKILNPTLK